MITSGFNHADSGTNFNEIFNANDKPLIYHFENGETIVMNKGNDGYYAKVGNVNYFYGEDGLKEYEESSSGLEIVRIDFRSLSLDFTVTDSFVVNNSFNTPLTSIFNDRNLYNQLTHIDTRKLYILYFDGVEIVINGFADLEEFQVSFMDDSVYGKLDDVSYIKCAVNDNYLKYGFVIENIPLIVHDTNDIQYNIKGSIIFTPYTLDNIQASIFDVTFPYGTITRR